MKKVERQNLYYPVFLNLNGKKCVVVGGGQVAHRKARALLESGAEVEIISPLLCPELVQLAIDKSAKVIPRNYRKGDLQGAFLAIAATDDNAANSDIAAEAQNSMVLVNVVDDADKSSFILPAHLSRGDLAIAVSTSGKGPALARKIKTKLEQDFGEEYATLINLIDKARQEIKAHGIEVDADSWQEALNLDLLLDLIKHGDSERAKAVLLDNLKARRKSQT